MKRIMVLTSAILIASMLAACSPGINIDAGYHISFDQNGLVMHAPGEPDAHVSQDGDLGVAGKAVAVTPAQRELLKRYYSQAVEVMDSSKSVGKQGAEIAKQGIGNAIASILHGDSSAVDKQMDARSQKIENAASQLCGDIKALGATQKAIATEIPAFAPYASNDRLECTVTHSTIYKVNGTKSASFTYALRKRSGSDASTVETLSRPSTPSPKSSAPTASRP